MTTTTKTMTTTDWLSSAVTEIRYKNIFPWVWFIFGKASLSLSLALSLNLKHIPSPTHTHTHAHTGTHTHTHAHTRWQKVCFCAPHKERPVPEKNSKLEWKKKIPADGANSAKNWRLVKPFYKGLRALAHLGYFHGYLPLVRQITNKKFRHYVIKYHFKLDTAEREILAILGKGIIAKNASFNPLAKYHQLMGLNQPLESCTRPTSSLSCFGIGIIFLA